MAAKCDVCGKMTKRYHTTYAGDIVCYGICLQVYRLESYLLRMEERRERDQRYHDLVNAIINKHGYEFLRELRRSMMEGEEL